MWPFKKKKEEDKTYIDYSNPSCFDGIDGHIHIKEENKVIGNYYGYPVYEHCDYGAVIPCGGGYMAIGDYHNATSAKETQERDEIYYNLRRDVDRLPFINPTVTGTSSAYSSYDAFPTGSAYNPYTDYAKYLNCNVMSVDEVHRLMYEGNWEKVGKKMVQEVQYKCPYCRTRFTMPNDDTTNCPKCGGPQNDGRSVSANQRLIEIINRTT